MDWRATSFEPDGALYERLAGQLVNSTALERIKGVPSGTVAFGLQPIPKGAVHAGIARGGNALGLQQVEQTWFFIDSGWAQASDDQKVHEATKSMVDSVKADADESKKHLAYIFANDASYDQEVIGGYGRGNVAKLKAVSAKYDGHQVFQELVPGGFKLTTSA